MRLRELHVGCLGGGTGLPSLLGGLKSNPWLQVHAIVTMFDSGGSSGVLRDELGVLPPGDVLKCALALARETDLVATVPERHTAGLHYGMHIFALPFAIPPFTISMLWHPRMDGDLSHRWLRSQIRGVCGKSAKR